MKTITKVALAVCGFGLLLSSKAKAMPSSVIQKYTPSQLNMGDPAWANHTVGDSAQICGNIGCMATAAIASANTMKGRTMRVDTGLDLIKNGGGFKGAELILGTAMSLLGCRQSESERIRGSRNIPELRAKIEDTLKNGGVAMVHVDYDLSTPLSNHFIMCYGVDPVKGYLCMDPAGGQLITLDANLHCQRTKTKTYDATGVAPLWPT